MQNRLENMTKFRLFWPLAALAMMVLFNIIFVPDFLHIEMKNGILFGRIIDIFNRGAPLMLMAIGMTLVIATGGIDISVGSVAAISGAVACMLIGRNAEGTASNPMWLAIALALLVTVATGLWNGLLVAKLGIQPVIATLVLFVAGRGIAQLITAGQIAKINYKPYEWIGTFVPGIPLPFSIIIAAAVLIIVLIVLKKTALGLFIEAVGINPQASRFTGINVIKIKMLVYTFSGLCAGIAGLIITSMIRGADANNAGDGMEMDAILAVAMGGTMITGGKFSIGASVTGALMVQSITTTMYAIGISSHVLPLVKAVVVILICLLQSETFRRKVAGLVVMKRGGERENTAIKL